MTCREGISELVECCRRGGIRAQPSREFRAHLAVCGICHERWEAEKQLTAEFGLIRERVGTLASPASRREALMQGFTALHRGQRTRPLPNHAWHWGLGVAAALLCALVVGHGAVKRKPAPASHAVLYEARNALSSDASSFSSDDFIAVPYTPPLAPGELVRIVRTNMYPEALAGMGVDVDPSWAADLPVEMVVGEDGIPRAVRITDNSQF
jgi:hypothetical protein